MNNLIVNDILKKLNEKGESYIVGGYLRDIKNNLIPNDIDIITSLHLDEVKEIFPSLNYTEKGYEVGIGRFSYKGNLIEISTYPNLDPIDSIKNRDFTINSLYSDGENIFDLFNACDDINKKIIKPLENPNSHFKKNPQAYLRAIRLTSYLNYSISDELFLFLIQNKDIFNNIDKERIRMEGYKIIQSDYPLKAIRTLQELKFLPFEKNFNENQKIKNLSEQLDTKIAFIGSVVGHSVINEYLNLFDFSKRVKDKVHYLSDFIQDENIEKNIHIINDILILKRYQYPNNPIKIREIILKISEIKKRQI